MVEDQAGVVGARGSTKRSLLANGHAVDLRRVSGDFAHAVTAICCNAMSEALLAVADCYDALRVAVPCQVVDAASNDVVVACMVISFLPLAAAVVHPPFVAPSPAQSHTLTVPETSPLAT